MGYRGHDLGDVWVTKSNFYTKGSLANCREQDGWTEEGCDSIPESKALKSRSGEDDRGVRAIWGIKLGKTSISVQS
jgi:hypothetical protein